jgi:hypothetical protein
MKNALLFLLIYISVSVNSRYGARVTPCVGHSNFLKSISVACAAFTAHSGDDTASNVIMPERLQTGIPGQPIICLTN